MKYVTRDFETFRSPIINEDIIFNPSDSFCILKTLNKREIISLFNEYSDCKWKISWDELLAQKKKEIRKNIKNKFPECIRMLSASKGSLLYIKSEPVIKAFKLTYLKDINNVLKTMSIDDQIAIVNTFKPSSAEEAHNLFIQRGGLDLTGIKSLKPIIDKCDTIDKVVSMLAACLYDQMRKNVTQQKSGSITSLSIRCFLEFFAFLHSKRIMLFPFIFKSSSNPFFKYMLHKNNVAHSFNPHFCDKSIIAFHDSIISNATVSSLHRLASDARCFIQASTFSKIEQLSDEVLDRMIEITEDIECEGTNKQQVASRYNTFSNTLIGLFNASHNVHEQKLTYRKKELRISKTHEESTDFSFICDNNPNLEHWSKVLTKYCLSTEDSQYGARIQLSNILGKWLLTLQDPPRDIFNVVRSIHINDYGDGPTLRNYFKNNYSISACNRMLTLSRQLFDFAHDVLQADYVGRIHELPSFTNPVDNKFDRFQEEKRIGTKRKPIEARIMETMRNIIIENDYEWPRNNFEFSYHSLTNHLTNKFEKDVFCPSVSNLLYFMLWIPTRKIQAQLLDTGEGDDHIFDFETNMMIKNPNKLSTESGRAEGVIQMLPSGMLGINDIIGIHITTNKSNGDGYDIPWINADLLNIIKNQLAWLKQYAPYPKPKGRESLGKKLSKKVEEAGKKYYILFRDPTATRVDDPDKPVQGTRIRDAWGLLCAETERRLNNDADNIKQQVSLINDYSKKYPISRYDIHTLRVSGITDLLEKGVPLGIVQKFVAGHATYVMTLWYDNPSYAKIREYLELARTQDNNSISKVAFNDYDYDEIKDYLVINQSLPNVNYTAFDALEENSSVISIKMSGICPGTSCEEGGIDKYEQISPVPVGDRGPSCPQCRFWITGPMFLLGQVIEGNQLIRKIKKMTSSINTIRESMINAEDDGDTHLYNNLSGREDREMRILSNMITEWAERMKFYEASVKKLDDWILYNESKSPEDTTLPEALFTKSNEENVRFNFEEKSELELTHFISTVAEFFPEFIDSDDTSVPDLEQAISTFMATNDLGNFFFKLNDKQRIHASNMMTGLLIENVGAHSANELINGDTSLSNFPDIKQMISTFLTTSEPKSFKLNNTKSLVKS